MNWPSNWEDGNISKTLVVMITGLILAATIFLYVTKTDVKPNIFNYIVLSSFLVLVMTLITSDKIKTNHFGKNKQMIYLGLFIGVAIGLIAGFGKQGGTSYGIVLPELAIGTYGFFLIGVLAPLIEPLFWRGLVTPTLQIYLKKYFGDTLSNIAAILVSAGGFAIYHLLAYSSQAQNFEATYELLKIAFFFGIIFNLANIALGTVAVEIGWHLVNNLFAAGYTTIEILGGITLFMIGMIVLIEIASRKGE